MLFLSLGRIVIIDSTIVQWLLRVKLATKTYHASEKMHKAQPLRDRVMTGAMFVGYMVMPFLWALVPNWWIFGSTSIDVPAYGWIQLLGLIVTAAGVCLFWLSHKHLGANWSPYVEVLKEQKLITTGVYSYVRHPMYSAFFLLSFGHALSALRCPWVALCGIASVLLMYLSRVTKEEAVMRAQFGVQYQNYCLHTPRLIPCLSPCQSTNKNN
ncbi:isoprenylcysteine carboxylmethyltransferase family protein [Pelomyxa schiedti]|nr:isoprenylcysteine carboxylmethyltransferase family protein [Pelomyxa schiedti]